MKKSFIYAGAILAATISLTNCTKEINGSDTVLPEGIPFEICANPTTKTTIDGLSTKWADGDGINVFHAAAGTKEYVSDNEFTIAGDLADGRFTGALSAALGEGTYDWYAIYPYSEHIVSPANTSTGYSYIGSRSDSSQKQTGVDNMSHIAGENYPLYGKSTTPTSASEMPSINMKPAFSVLRVKVTNTTGTALEVSNISFTAPEAIVGTFYIDFSGDAAVYTDGNHVSNKASLAVTEASIDAGASAEFYLAVKPFTAQSGSNLTLSVNGYDKKLTLTKNIAFTAGHIKTLGFEFDKVQTVFTWNLSVDSTSEATEEKIAWTGSWGEMTCIKASSSSATAANNYYPGTSGKNYTSTRFYKNSTLSITPAKSLTYYVFEATTADYASALASSEWTNATTDVDGTTVTIVAADPSKAVSAEIGGTCGFTRVDCHTDAAVFPPIISVSPSSLDVPSAGAVPTIRYSIKRPIDGGKITAKSDKDWVNTFDYSVDGEISFVVNENTGEKRTANITISYPGAEDAIIVVSQKEEGAAPEPKSYEWNLKQESKDWTKNGCVTYFSQPYGIKKVNAYIINKTIKDFTLASPSKISVSVKSLQNGGTTSILTVYLVDSNGKIIGEGRTITPVNASDASKTTYQEVVFDSNLSGATGIMVTCTTFGKNILINGVKYTVTY